ncbi:hypothetical protein D9M72_581620 [compost metagenome]
MRGEREAGELDQREQDQEDLATHEAEALAGQLHRQIDEDTVIGDRDQHPRGKQADAAAPASGREQREDRFALHLLRLQRGDFHRNPIGFGNALKYRACLFRASRFIQVER